VNKFIVIKLNTKKISQKSTKNSKNESKKTFTVYKGDMSQNSKTAKWFWGDIIAC